MTKINCEWFIKSTFIGLDIMTCQIAHGKEDEDQCPENRDKCCIFCKDQIRCCQICPNITDVLRKSDIPYRATSTCVACGKPGIVIVCDLSETDYWKCSKCNELWKARCNFDDDYSD